MNLAVVICRSLSYRQLEKNVPKLAPGASAGEVAVRRSNYSKSTFRTVLISYLRGLIMFFNAPETEHPVLLCHLDEMSQSFVKFLGSLPCAFNEGDPYALV